MGYELYYSKDGVHKITIQNNENYEEFYSMEDACKELNRLANELKIYKKQNFILKKSLDDVMDIEKMLK